MFILKNLLDPNLMKLFGESVYKKENLYFDDKL